MPLDITARTRRGLPRRRRRFGFLLLALLVPAPAPAFFGKILSRGGAKVAPRLVGRSAVQGGEGAVARLVTRARGGVSIFSKPLRSARLSKFGQARLPNKGAGVKGVRDAGRAKLRDGETIAGLRSVVYRTSSGRTIVAKPNRFQKDVYEVAQGSLQGAEKIVGVESATFVTSQGRLVFGSQGVHGVLAKLGRGGSWLKFVAGPAAGAFVWKLFDRLTLITAANEIKDKTEGPPPEDDGIDGGGDTIIQIDTDKGGPGDDEDTIIRIESEEEDEDQDGKRDTVVRIEDEDGSPLGQSGDDGDDAEDPASTD